MRVCVGQVSKFVGLMCRNVSVPAGIHIEILISLLFVAASVFAMSRKKITTGEAILVFDCFIIAAGSIG